MANLLSSHQLEGLYKSAKYGLKKYLLSMTRHRHLQLYVFSRSSSRKNCDHVDWLSKKGRYEKKLQRFDKKEKHYLGTPQGKLTMLPHRVAAPTHVSNKNQ